MRVVILACSLALAMAQTPPDTNAKAPKDFVHAPDFQKLWRQARTARPVYITEFQQAEKPCSIPLTNITPKVRSRMPVVKPEQLGKTVPMPQVEMPAPPCPEERK